MVRTAADEANDPIPTLDGIASGAGAPLPYWVNNTIANLEAGRVTGPAGIEVYHHFPRYADPNFTNFQNIPDNYASPVETWRLGRLLQNTTYPLGTSFTALPTLASQITTQSYVPIYFPIGGALGNQQSVLPIRHGACSDSRCPAGDASTLPDKTALLVRPVTTTVTRGVNAYTTTNENYMAFCGRPTTVTENGQRNRSMIFVFDRAGYCQTTSQLTNENGARRARIAAPLTADLKNAASATRYGPTDTGGLTVAYTCNAAGEVATTTDARGYSTFFNNYKRGTPQTEWHPVGAASGATDPNRITITRVVDDLGRITSETDGEAHTTQVAYNGMHKPTAITLPRAASSPLAFTYGASSDIITRGSRTETVGYDGLGRVTTYHDGINNTSYRYDSAGRRNFVSFPGSSLGQTVEFDALNRPTRLTEPNPDTSGGATVTTTLTYNDAVNPPTITLQNPRGFSTVLAMEAFADPASAWLTSRSSPEIGVMTISRNVFGQVERVSQGGLNRDRVYDANKGYFLIQETHPETGTTFFDRDNNGNLTGKRVGSTSAPNTVYGYDGQNRLAATIPPVNGAQASPAVYNDWYKTGLLKATNTTEGIGRNYFYDENNNLTSEQIIVPGTLRTLGYDYDARDSLARMTYPSGKVIDFNPDVLGRPRQAASTSLNVVSNATYWPSGLPQSISFANGITQDYTEQSRPLVSALNIARTNTATSLMSLGFGYDAVGNLTSTTDALALGYARSASYDGFDRILTNATPRGSESFSFDPVNVGDIASKTGATFNYNASTRLLASVTGATPAGNRAYSYDNYGNATGDGRFSFDFDALNSLRQVKQTPASGGSTVASYTYDGHQHLAQKVSPEGSTHYLYGQHGRLYGEYSISPNGDSKQKEFAYLGNKLVGQSTAFVPATTPSGCGFNVDGLSSSVSADATSDGLLITRHNRGLAGGALIAGARVDQTAANLPTTSATINAHMDRYQAAHDMDGNGSVTLTDALLITRYLAGFRGPALTSGLSLSGTRTSATEIEAYIAQGCPSNANNETLSFIHPNVSGSPIMATDAYGNPSWREDYLTFGEKTKFEASQNANTNAFIGKPQDATTGLVYFGARWYDPTVARFLSFDPTDVDEGNPHSFNRYAYGNNNPFKFLDPDGRAAIAIVGGMARQAAAAQTIGSTTLANPGAPRLDPATGIMVNPAQPQSTPYLGGFLAHVNQLLTLFTPIHLADALAGILTNATYSNQTRDQLFSSKSSFEKLIAEHQQKIADFKADPYAPDNLGTLRNSKSEHAQKIIDGRIRALEKQLSKQQGELDKVNNALEGK